MLSHAKNLRQFSKPLCLGKQEHAGVVAGDSLVGNSDRALFRHDFLSHSLAFLQVIIHSSFVTDPTQLLSSHHVIPFSISLFLWPKPESVPLILPQEFPSVVAYISPSDLTHCVALSLSLLNRNYCYHLGTLTQRICFRMDHQNSFMQQQTTRRVPSICSQAITENNGFLRGQII